MKLKYINKKRLLVLIHFQGTMFCNSSTLIKCTLLKKYQDAGKVHVFEPVLLISWHNIGHDSFSTKMSFILFHINLWTQSFTWCLAGCILVVVLVRLPNIKKVSLYNFFYIFLMCRFAHGTINSTYHPKIYVLSIFFRLF